MVPDPNVVNFSRYVNLENIFYAYVTHIVYWLSYDGDVSIMFAKQRILDTWQK